jgi:DNA-binding NtrC family response regulator
MRTGNATEAAVLIVDDEVHMREIVVAALASLKVKVFGAASADQAFEILGNENIDVVVSDFRMPRMDGLEFLRRVREERPAIRFVMFSGQGNMETVIQALRLGASDFVTKPFENHELRAIVGRLLNMPGSALPLASVRQGEPQTGLLGESSVFLNSLESARKAARTQSTVFISGESGTGKEGFARFIHETSDRSEAPFIPVNCGALPENLIESELFGHVRGAFTGALSDRPGKFVLAHGGTLFLDEIGEMPMSMQVRLLRALQEHVVEPVGSGAPVRTDFRLIAATNRDLREEVRAGRFREDLWFRLHVVPVQLPPLRERGRDIVLLARHFLSLFNIRYGTSLDLSSENERTLLAHLWPGNVRELANAMERAVVLSDGAGLMVELDSAQDAVSPGATYTDVSVRGRRRAAEREVILAALEACRWNKTQAAERLGISRRGLLYKVKEYGIG